MPHWGSTKWFQPRYIHEGNVYGHHDNGCPACYEYTSENWELFEEPNPKVMRAQYAYRYTDNQHYVTGYLYKNDSEFIDAVNGVAWFKRLDEIECES
ncbi:MAG: hypothetical protein KDD61_06635 [Bdellovibrionales bacterium]|nr:hypothetical protein [Bdellovibrionales bacterium]